MKYWDKKEGAYHLGKPGISKELVSSGKFWVGKWGTLTAVSFNWGTGGMECVMAKLLVCLKAAQFSNEPMQSANNVVFHWSGKCELVRVAGISRNTRIGQT